MMYNNHMAVAIKVAGKVLREVGDIVYLPFGSEYSLYLSNQNNVRASVSITIDGESISDGSEFVIDANGKLSIERFLRGDNMSEGNRFKFIERTAGIESHRGVGIDDGLIRFEWKFEKKRPVTLRRHSVSKGGFMRGMGSETIGMSYNSSTVDNAQLSTMDVQALSIDAGITTEGSISDQQFQTVSNFLTEAESHVSVLRLMGETENNRRVSAPVTTRTKPICNKCGTRAKSFSDNFCGDCGTSLQLIV